MKNIPLYLSTDPHKVTFIAKSSENKIINLKKS